ncbi:BMP family protein [Homoserinimonas sp. OAct 916]|uniref:BMP family lipoprotein n=1 Tax=Homoserinimonas sp. OAct 916 TaxID=2211450 RepID=UPI001300BA02|nr:BMP family ABC transporter substrate-binding protein [Homoserinimonas sp. OAct 916]
MNDQDFTNHTKGSRLPRYATRAAIAAVAALSLTLVGCSGKAPDAVGTSADGPTIGIFVDNAFGDGDFFDQAAGAEATLASEFNASVKTYEGQLQAQNFEPLLQDAADANELVFVLGFEAIDAMIKTADSNPDTTFVFVDGVVDNPAIVSAEFRTAEGCFMAGALAAVNNQGAGKSVAGFIGGVNAPVIENCQSGYEQGVAQADSSQTVSSQYVGSFVDPAKGSEIATALANKGAFSMFAYAGLSGAGAFDAAKSGADIAPIGVVADKSSLAPGKVPGSLTMGVDKVILATTQKFVSNELTKGESTSYGFAEGGWAMVYDDTLLSSDQLATLADIQEQITSGSLTVTAK